MNALDSQRALLDSLMGVHRDHDDDEPIERLHWRDEEVCKYYICGFCPHDLFVNTKSDLGPCEKIHDDQLRREFEKERESTRDRYERRFISFLQDIVYLLERKIQRGRARINLELSDTSTENKLTKTQRDRLHDIEDQIEDGLTQMEDLGNKGKVQEAQELLAKVETLKKEKITIKAFAAQAAGQEPGKKLIVCDVCGAFLVLNDAESRVDAHLQGRTHQGFQLIRDKIEELMEKQDKAANQSGDGSRSRSRSKKRRKKSRRSRSRSRSRSSRKKRRAREEEAEG